MKKSIFIKIKAAFLLFTFSITMIIGCLCSLGVNMGFNSKHCSEIKECDDDHCDKKNDSNESKQKKDNCCNDHVIKFNQLDKSFSQNFVSIHPAFFSILRSSFFNIDILHISDSSVSIKYFVRGHHPPIQNIRIAIQSFQI